jgi:hypothetical protein
MITSGSLPSVASSSSFAMAAAGLGLLMLAGGLGFEPRLTESESLTPR